jgi:hypothetical protein
MIRAGVGLEVEQRARRPVARLCGSEIHVRPLALGVGSGCLAEDPKKPAALAHPAPTCFILVGPLQQVLSLLRNMRPSLAYLPLGKAQVRRGGKVKLPSIQLMRSGTYGFRLTSTVGKHFYVNVKAKT